jgi:DDE superfamily endonuclease/CENP-B N-terminal DNA-binding domain
LSQRSFKQHQFDNNTIATTKSTIIIIIITMPRRTLTLGEKLAIIAECKKRREAGQSLRSIGFELGVQPKQIRDWMKKEAKLHGIKKTKKTVHLGRPRLLSPYEEELMVWFTNHRESGLPMSIKTVTMKAVELVPQFDRLSTNAQYQAVRRLLRANCITIRCKTRVSQRRPQDVVDAATTFVKSMVPFLQAPDVSQDFIINMDQTPVPFSLQGMTTLNLSGATTINITTSDKKSRRFTASLAVTASGKKLKPMFTFKGKPDGRIATKELPNNPRKDDVFLNCQENAWFDGDVALRWIAECLAPYVREVPVGIRPLLILDDYKVHKMESVKEALDALGVTLNIIPGGCTCLAQPIDVGIGKPFKHRIREQWMSWMLDQGVDRTAWETPKRELVTEWAWRAWVDLPDNIVKNSWRKTDFSYFPEVETESEEE